MKEIQTQVKSFRITEETAAKLKEIAAMTGKNQQETLAMLISTYEMQGGKEALPGKKDDIDKFQGLMNSISRMYLSALEDCQDAKEIAKTYYEAELTSKDNLIIELQKKAEGYKEEKEETLKLLQEKDRMIKELQEKNSRYEEVKALQEETNAKLLAGKEELLTERTNALGKAQKQIYTLQDKLDQSLIAQKNMDLELKQMKKEHKSMLDTIEEQDSRLKAKEVAYVELEENLAKIKKLYEGSLHKMEENYQKEMNLHIEKAVYEAKLGIHQDFEEKLSKAQEEKEAFREKYYELLEKTFHQK